MRVLDTVSGLAQMSGKLRPRAAPDAGLTANQEPGGGRLETHLAGVVVAALKEAFDRDRTRLELERAQLEAERRRAQEALATELRRQATERALGQLRLIAVMALAAWMLSAALAVWLPGCARAFLERCSARVGRWRLLRSGVRSPAGSRSPRGPSQPPLRHPAAIRQRALRRPPRRGHCCSRSRPSAAAFWPGSNALELSDFRTFGLSNFRTLEL